MTFTCKFYQILNAYRIHEYYLKLQSDYIPIYQNSQKLFCGSDGSGSKIFDWVGSIFLSPGWVRSVIFELGLGLENFP